MKPTTSFLKEVFMVKDVDTTNARSLIKVALKVSNSVIAFFTNFEIPITP